MYGSKYCDLIGHYVIPIQFPQGPAGSCSNYVLEAINIYSVLVSSPSLLPVECCQFSVSTGSLHSGDEVVISIRLANWALKAVAV